MTIAKWFMNKNYSQSECYAMSTTEPAIERETEKAYLLKFDTEFGTIKGWFPKSVCNSSAPNFADVTDINVGDIVKHNAFGEGSVLVITDYTAVVKFACGEKEIAKAWLTI